jgi:hypothetical protein
MMSLTKAKAVAANPSAYSTAELDDALTVIVEDDRLSEAQVTRLQAKIDPVLRARIQQVRDTCTHPEDQQSFDLETNERHCAVCGWLRDAMPWEEWAKLPTESHLIPMPEAKAKPAATRKAGA